MKNRRFKKRNLRSGGFRVRKACGCGLKTKKRLIEGYEKRCSEEGWAPMKFSFYKLCQLLRTTC